MSAFHNSRLWEKAALAWHAAGTFVHIAGFVCGVAVMATVFAIRPIILAFIPELYPAYLWLGIFGLIYWAGGIFFHLWASLEHIDHMKNLPSYDGN
jgi:hypothetical protein